MDAQVPEALSSNIGALIIRIGVWGPEYYNYKKEPTKYSSIGRPLC